ncbi:S-methyl-5-thioribose-1-phosphate isomerase [Pelotomaculum isophthalicicum JI]|uniref:Methylthioribose-1-phosphate isomerase n=2 Tax=Pelotomaculum TaxID=191373 RepID=A0A9X4JVE8_9FIRM|nr:S-methyl-5-thioribose-1-phosphate isomerase [Pelotomaculum isophthalicicum]MDF9407348.1 S-methyl-5-thioribose-1-phosphate isomerase [Pelotomaculum isophthalicicum JI]
MRWLEEGCLELLDQTKLPLKVTYLKCRDYLDVAAAIKRLAVRGAPAIGTAAAYGLTLGAMNLKTRQKEEFLSGVKAIASELSATRPTAVNLRWALDRMIKKLHIDDNEDVNSLRTVLLEEANLIYQEDIETNRKIGKHGQALIPNGSRVLTHCNAGALATAGYGTALGVIRAAREAGKNISVIADETRPLLQGARLTAWEMLREHIPVTLITDNMAGYLMATQKVDLIIVGADRITANGDVANKIGTYSLAVLAKAHNLPFYVAAPLSTIDMSLASGAEIPIEERDHTEITHLDGKSVAPPGVKAWNPAFDVTPNHLVTAIITERGVIYPAYLDNLDKIINH